MTTRIIVGDALSSLRELPDESVLDLPVARPFVALQSTEVLVKRFHALQCLTRHAASFAHRQRAGRTECLAHFVNLNEKFCLPSFQREVRQEPLHQFNSKSLRNMHPIWLNYGDAYAHISGGGLKQRSDKEKGPNAAFRDAAYLAAAPHSGMDGLKPKDLMMMPARVAMALQADGWWLRSMIPQIKTNPMPESVTDRPTSAVEYWFMLTKTARYFYDAEAVKEPVSGTANARVAKAYKMPDGWDTGPGAHGTIHRKGREKGKVPGVTPKSAEPGSGIRQNESYQAAMIDQPATRNMRNWIMAATAPFKGAHFATFAPQIVVPWIKAVTSALGVCPDCGAPWVRETGDKKSANGRGSGNKERKLEDGVSVKHPHRGRSIPWEPSVKPTTGWCPSCDCDAGDVVPATVLDPFGGAGTVGLVADQLGRDSILIEINPDYAEMARERIEGDAPLLSDVAAE